MCGIAGFIDFSASLDKAVLARMTATLGHRGPDDNGLEIYNGRSARVGLGHTRLSILDVSEAGHQPMSFLHFTIVFNGEIYNFREIRNELRRSGHQFKTETDTEVVLHAFAEWGIDCLEHFTGMFAFCLYDVQNEKVYLVRDRAGVKPLYVYQWGKGFLFASELKAFHVCPVFSPEVSLPEVSKFFDYGYVPDDGCIFENCSKVDAGQYWVLDLASRNKHKVQYWNIYDCFREPKLKLDYAEAINELESRLRKAFSYRMVSDVPVGVFLSGGYDSTAVAALLQAESMAPIKTFTIGFWEGNDEAPFARQTAQHLGTDHHEHYCSKADAQEIIPSLASVYDEPFADSSAIPTLLVSKLARQHVKVAVSADAGDELFCGYQSYQNLYQQMGTVSRVPQLMRPTLAWLGLAGSHMVRGLLPRLSHQLNGVGKALVGSDSLTGQAMYAASRRTPWHYRNKLLKGNVEVPDANLKYVIDDSSKGLEGAMVYDYGTYLKDDILVKVDRATMFHGLEGREPLVDHHLAEFAAKLPFSYKFDGKTPKRILKDIVHRYVPAETMQRPKAGFSLPINAWLRGDFSYLLDDLCSPGQLKKTGFLNESFLTGQIQLFKQNKLHYSPIIWRLLMFQLWHRQWVSGDAIRGVSRSN